MIINFYFVKNKFIKKKEIIDKVLNHIFLNHHLPTDAGSMKVTTKVVPSKNTPREKLYNN